MSNSPCCAIATAISRFQSAVVRRHAHYHNVMPNHDAQEDHAVWRLSTSPDDIAVHLAISTPGRLLRTREETIALINAPHGWKPRNRHKRITLKTIRRYK